MKIKIGNRRVGEGEPCFIIAEAGVNHNGDVKLAKRLIDAAVRAGADAIKFQTFKAEKIVTKTASKAAYQKKTTASKESQLEMLKQLELNESDFKSLARYAKQKKIIFLSTPFDGESADFLDRIGVPAFKIASGEITNFPLLRRVARKGRPMILSTGMATMGEIEKALDVIKISGAKNVILLHCVTSYPARVEHMNLKVMSTLKQTFELPVGLSDHTLGMAVPTAAAALGAVVIEKHFTLDRNLPGPDHKASLEPGELKDMVKAIRDVEKALGNGIKRPTEEEEEIKKVARKSIVAKVDIPRGRVITEKMLDFKRPGTAISPSDTSSLLGKKAKRNVKCGEPITYDTIGE